jgi:hypothetical protein
MPIFLLLARFLVVFNIVIHAEATIVDETSASRRREAENINEMLLSRRHEGENIVGFYHTALASDDMRDKWLEIVTEQTKMIENSTLGANTQRVWVGAVGQLQKCNACYQRDLAKALGLPHQPWRDDKWMKSALFLPHNDAAFTSAVFPSLPETMHAMATFAKDPVVQEAKFVLGLLSDVAVLAEYATLWLMYAHCHAHPRDLVWYMHSKGTRHQSCWAGGTPDGTTCADDWRHMMTWFLAHHTLDWCLPRLHSGSYDICAPNWVQSASHASGNFWLTSCAWVLGRERPFPQRPHATTYTVDGRTLLNMEHFDGDRLDAEFWIGDARFGRPANGYCMHRAHIIFNGTHIDVNHYKHEYPEELYRDAVDGENCMQPSADQQVETTPAGTWKFCAYEAAMCAIETTATVRFGLAGTYKTRELSPPGAMCDRDVFGGDPVQNMQKRCDYLIPNTG